MRQNSEVELQSMLLDAATRAPTTPGVTFAIEEQDNGSWSLVIRCVRLGKVGLVSLRREAGRIRATAEVAGDLDDTMTRARHQMLESIALPIMHALGADVDALPFTPKGIRKNGGVDVPVQRIPCPRCNAVVAFLIHAESATTVGGLADHARLLHSEIVRLDVPTWVLGPALGGGPILERPADMLKVWPTQEPVRRQRPQDLNRHLDPLIHGHQCKS